MGEVMITIKNIEWLDREYGEAFYTLTDGTYNLYVFQSDGFNQTIGEEFLGEFISLDADSLIQDDVDYGTTGVYHPKNGSQILMGELTKEGLQIGEFIFEEDLLNLPGGINIGDYIEVTTSRVDVL